MHHYRKHAPESALAQIDSARGMVSWILCSSWKTDKLQQLLAMSHGTLYVLCLLPHCTATDLPPSCFMAFDGYGWYLSSTAALLYSSWVIHNIVAWMKVRPFFCDPKSLFKPSTGKWVRNIYLGTLACSVPPIILQIFDNFRFFNNINDFYRKVRPYEPLFRYDDRKPAWRSTDSPAGILGGCSHVWHCFM
jgi:hypothetical protein